MNAIITTNPLSNCYNKPLNRQEIYNGIPTFLGVPFVQNIMDVGLYEVAVLGVPWEGPITWGSSSGCELATKSVREAAIRYGGFLPEYEYDLFDHISVCDVGDVNVVAGNTQQTHENLYKKAKSIFDANTIALTYGGDHSISVPIINALIDKYPNNVGIVHLDAHMDNLESLGDEKFARCSPFARIYENAKIDPTKIIHMGIRGPRNTEQQLKHAKNVGANVITINEIKKEGVERIVQKCITLLGDVDAVYVSVCSDILDVAFNPGGPPDMNGISSSDLSYILYELAKNGIKGFDFVEIYPPSDHKNISSHVAAWMGIYTMSGIAANKMRKG